MTKRRQSQPVSALDVAAYILANHTRNTPILAWKMHKLVYFCQVYQLIIENIPFYSEKIMTNQKGVVINELCILHNNHFYLGDSSRGNLNHLSLKQIDIIDKVVKKYGKLTEEEFDKLIHLESPWTQVRKQAGDSKVSLEITPSLIQEFYRNKIQ